MDLVKYIERLERQLRKAQRQNDRVAMATIEKKLGRAERNYDLGARVV